jgi:hypothetical protein
MSFAPLEMRNLARQVCIERPQSIDFPGHFIISARDNAGR